MEKLLHVDGNDGSARQIGRVRTLLVLRDLGEITEAPVNALIAFYGSVSHLECAAIGKADYQQHLIDAQLQRNHVDFGLYGTRLLFLTESYEDPTTGVFCKEPGLIGRYQDFFRTIWNHPVAQKDIPSTAPAVTLDEQCESMTTGRTLTPAEIPDAIHRWRPSDFREH